MKINEVGIEIKGNDIIINVEKIKECVPTEYLDFTMKLKGKIPKMDIYEDNNKVVSFDIEPRKVKDSNPDKSEEYENLDNKFLHGKIAITKDFIIHINGFMNDIEKCTEYDRKWYGIVCQPFQLSISTVDYEPFKGKGLIERGVLSNGVIRSTNFQSICICDECHKSFSIITYNFPMMFAEYIYSADSSVTLSVSDARRMKNDGTWKSIIDIEEELPEPRNGSGKFKYYNSFRCPHCKAPYIDFEKYPEIRKTEYKGNVYLNDELQHF